MSNEVSIPDRLKWLRDQLQRLLDNGRIRSEGETDFIIAKGELDDIIATYTAPMAPAPNIVNRVFGPGEMEAFIKEVSANAISTAVDSNRIAEGIRAMLSDEIEKSDVALMAALEATRTELLAAVAPAA